MEYTFWQHCYDFWQACITTQLVEVFSSVYDEREANCKPFFDQACLKEYGRNYGVPQRIAAHTATLTTVSIYRDGEACAKHFVLHHLALERALSELG